MKKDAAAINPEQIVEDLLGYYHSRKNAEELLGYIEASKELVGAVAPPQAERCVSDELAGAIATLASVVCTKRSKAALVMVTGAADKKHYAAILGDVIAALKELGHLGEDVEMVNKGPAHSYFCMKRYKGAVSNGQMFPNGTEDSLSVGLLSKKLAGKVCVNKCGGSCFFYDNCRYQRLMKGLRTGAVRVQVYDVRQYRSALNGEKLPKSRMVVYTPASRKIINERGGCVLTETELVNLSYDFDKNCSSLRRKKEFVGRRTSAIRGCSRQLYAMALDGADENEIKKLLTAIRKNLGEIRGECYKDLNKPDKRDLNMRLNSTIRRVEFLLNSRVVITHKNQGKRALVAA